MGGTLSRANLDERYGTIAAQARQQAIAISHKETNNFAVQHNQHFSGWAETPEAVPETRCAPCWTTSQRVEQAGDEVGDCVAALLLGHLESEPVQFSCLFGPALSFGGFGKSEGDDGKVGRVPR